MPDLFTLIYIRRKQVLLIVLISLAIATGIVLMMPSQYLASTTALPANPVATDKASVFNNNIRDLYSSLGESGDLDKIVGTGQLDTIYLSASDQFELATHYKIQGNNAAVSRRKAAAALKKNSRVTKSEYNELLVQVWDTDKNLTPQLANALMEKLAAIHQDLLNQSNQTIIKSLDEGQQKLQASMDSIRIFLHHANITPSQAQQYNDKLTVLQQQLSQYEKLKTEYQLMIDTKPAALLVVDKARASDQPDKPKKLLILLATAVLSFLFAAWLALILERRKARVL
ncbi:MAG: hypothetical protein E6Q24_09175 [Chitinophagaceae bacterium]|jgi:uncharacterized protein involved in exopolysaccharide biosynthesis|nr:MAG: hypothetical protein E6Q24_09175 [Chitinophagaceae bacterium]